MSNFFVNIPSDVADPGILTINADATVDQIITGDGGFVASTTAGTTTITANNLGVNVGQTTGTDHRPSMAFVKNAVVIGNNLGFNPPYGFNNPSVVTGLVIAGNASYSCPFIGSNLLFNGVSQGYLGFLKDSGSVNLPALVNLDVAGDNDLYFSLLHRSAVRKDLFKIGSDGAFSLLGVSGANLLFSGDGNGDIGSSDGGATYTRPNSLYVKTAIEIGAGNADAYNPALLFGKNTDDFFASLTLDTAITGTLIFDGAEGFTFNQTVGMVGASATSFICPVIKSGGAPGSNAIIADDGTVNADPSAVLEIASIDKGVLFPRMTTTQKNGITSPVAGLVVYDATLGKLCVFTGATWETITSV